MYIATRKSEYTSGKLKETDKKFAENAILEYKKIYRRNCCRIDANKYFLLSTQIRILLLMMMLEKMIEENKYLRELAFLLRYSSSEQFRRDINNNIIMDFNLESIFCICDFVGITFNEIKKRTLEDILVNLGEQRDKNEYDKFNKLYSNN